MDLKTLTFRNFRREDFTPLFVKHLERLMDTLAMLQAKFPQIGENEIDEDKGRM